jgi:hypothetical protein
MLIGYQGMVMSLLETSGKERQDQDRGKSK